MHGHWDKKRLLIDLEKKGEGKITFDRMIQSGTSVLAGIQLIRNTQAAHTATITGTKTTRKKFHNKLGHAGNALIDPTAEYLQVQISGTLEKCERT